MSMERLAAQMAPQIEAITAACEAANSQLIAVIKKQPSERILAAYQLGLRHFAHSYVQEALTCQRVLGAKMPEAIWHFIGRIQSNKTRHLQTGWERVHSVDRLRIATRLGQAACLVQVRLGGEHSKAGVEPADLSAFLDTLQRDTSIQVRGLMALPPPRHTWQDHNYFADLAHLRDDLQARGLLPSDGGELSMGTSADYQDGLAQGATWVRLGSALLGARTPPSRP